MTLTVRLDESMAAALTDYCEVHGTTKSQVVQQSLAAYLLRVHTPQPDRAQREVSAAFAAFEAAGLLGAGALGPIVADKAAVRRRVTGA